MAQSVSRSRLVVCLVAATLMAGSTTAFARSKKKKSTSAAAPAATATAAPATDATPATEAGEKKPAEGAAQAADQERPKPVVDENQEAPQSDEKGNVTFSGARAGKGRIIVSAPAKEKVKVYLEGRYFGVAPRTINKMPPGDYIVEGIFPDGRSVTKPVSVASDEEVTIELAPGDATAASAKSKLMPAAQAEKRWRTAKILGITSVAVMAVGGGVFGYLTHSTQSDYNNKSSSGAPQSQLDDLANKGNRYALGANACLIIGGVGLITAAIIGYPAYKARNAEKQPESPENSLSFLFAPSPRLDGASAAMVMRF
jgi:hypothetical protein